MHPRPSALPIDEILPRLLTALAERSNAVLQAAPGAGKTTRVPLALLPAVWLAGRRIIVLEPRRLAARAAARYMAASLGEDVGETIGYRVRMDSRVGPRTRIEVVTDGLFLRRLQHDQSLDGVGAVLFDEFHERGLDSDLALALCLDAQAALRPDLRLLVMSATLDTAAASRLLGDAPVIASSGRAFPVETRFAPRDVAPRDMEAAIAATIRQAFAEEGGSLLVFLPGQREIRRVQKFLEESNLPASARIIPLFGDMPLEDQDAAIAPAPPGVRKIVLATSIAETSLTIEGIRVVVDGGLMRVSRFDPNTGMTSLVTTRVSRASAEQRRGRAGRLEPGVCYRLWTEATHRALAEHTAPEIRETDLAPLALELARWGARDAGTLAWLDPPPVGALAQARDLLRQLGALDAQGAMTPHGQAMAELSIHPRLAHMMVRANAMNLAGLAADLASLVGERDILRPVPGGRDVDLRVRVELLRAGDRAESGRIAVDRGALRQARKLAGDWRRQLRARERGDDSIDQTGLLLALAFPDRIAQRRPGGDPKYRLSNGRGAFLAPTDPLAAQPWLTIADLDGAQREARIFLAAPVSQADLEEAFAGDITSVDTVYWDSRSAAVVARRQRRLFELVLDERPLEGMASEDRVAAAMIEGLRELGLASLPWTKELDAWRQRVAFLRGLDGADSSWPDMSDDGLLAGLETWLAPYLHGVTRRDHLRRIDLGAALKAMLPWEQQKALDAEAPTHVTVPSGSRIAIDYGAEGGPALAVKLQEMFGAETTPTVARGRVPLLLRLLSPAQRPIQVTRDLAGFWRSSYAEVRKDMRGQYPKHNWPEDPLGARPTARTIKRPRR